MITTEDDLRGQLEQAEADGEEFCQRIAELEHLLAESRAECERLKAVRIPDQSRGLTR